MLKMLLVDDEDLSRFAFRALLSRHFKDIEIVAEAENGQEAIDFFKLYEPDVVVMDIHMPGMDGLQTLKHITSIKPDINVLICSAYDNFDYVSKAMDLGAKGYLLKPVTKEDLNEKLKNLQINDKQLDIQNPLSDQTLIEMLLSGKPGSALKFDLKKIYQNNLEYGILILINNHADLVEDINSALSQIITEVIPAEQICLQAVIAGRLLLFISGCNNSGSSQDCDNHNLISQADQILESLEQDLDNKLKICTTIIKDGNWIEAWHTLNNSKQDLTAADREVKEIIADIINFVKNSNIDMAKIQLAKWFELVMPLQADKRLVFTVQLIFLLNHQLEEMRLDVDYRNFHRIINGEVDKNQPEMLELIVRQQLASTLEAIKIGAGRKHNLLERIDNILQEKALAEITLSSIAEDLGISSQYLCKAYKEETGSTFHKYLTSRRISLAKKLLKEPKMTIKEIAMQCGYQDTIYFTKLFKKINGSTPSEYRNRL